MQLNSRERKAGGGGRGITRNENKSGLPFSNLSCFSWKTRLVKTHFQELWEAVIIAKDLHIDDLLHQMKLNDTIIPNEDLAEQFASMLKKR